MLRHVILVALAVVLMPGSSLGAPTADATPSSPPNVVLILCDDLGYADLGCYGGKNPTPNLDRMASEGVRFTDYHVAQAVCSASRVALLTGCYPNRVGIQGALGPNAKHGVNPDETTLAEVCKSRGYATAIFGKWHLGHLPPFLPTRHGFDEYFGLPYSNDMWPKHPTMKFPDLPLMEGERTLELNPDQTKLTTQITERAVGFIERNKEKPFFLYVPHPMPHVPLFVSDKHAGRSGRGLYGDVIMEVDWSVGQILGALKRNALDERTLVIFSSDNGPWLSYLDHGGSAGPLREGKGTTFDGGTRVPCVMRWPTRIAGGRECREFAASIDVLPTLAKLIGATLSDERTIDGKDISPLVTGDGGAGARSSRDAYFYYWGRELQAVRSGKWKLHLAHTYLTPDPAGGGGGGQPRKMARRDVGPALYDMEAHPAESKDLAAENPDVVQRLTALAEAARDDLGDSALKREGKNLRPAGRAE